MYASILRLSKAIVYYNGSSGRNLNGYPEVGYLIFIADKRNNVNLIDCANIRSRKVVRSVSLFEIIGLTDACDVAIIIQKELK